MRTNTPEEVSDSMPSRGCIHVYTGNGKGKTTAALGLCLRAVGAGFQVYIAQFMKFGEYSEFRALKRLGPQVTIEQFGTGRFVRGTPSEEDRQAALQGFEAAKAALTSGDFQMVILDESMVALHQGLLTREQVHAWIDLRPEAVELILTGRYAPLEIIEKVDLVTEMHGIKHYFQNGVTARIGIEK